MYRSSIAQSEAQPSILTFLASPDSKVYLEQRYDTRAETNEVCCKTDLRGFPENNCGPDAADGRASFVHNFVAQSIDRVYVTADLPGGPAVNARQVTIDVRTVFHGSTEFTGRWVLNR